MARDATRSGGGQCPVPGLARAAVLEVAGARAHIDGDHGHGSRDMQTNNRFMDDIGQLMTNAMGVAQGARAEAETAMKSLMDRWMADRDFVTREEFDAVRAMAQKAREENDALRARLDAMAKG